MDLLDTGQAAALLNVSDRTLEAWRCRGEGPPFIRIGHRLIGYARNDLENWLNQRRLDPTGTTESSTHAPGAGR